MQTLFIIHVKQILKPVWTVLKHLLSSKLVHFYHANQQGDLVCKCGRSCVIHLKLIQHAEKLVPSREWRRQTTDHKAAFYWSKGHGFLVPKVNTTVWECNTGNWMSEIRSASSGEFKDRPSWTHSEPLYDTVILQNAPWDRQTEKSDI